MSPEPIDLHHLGRERIIASYLLDTDDGPALFDCGPSTTIEALKAGLADRGLSLTDVRHLLLSHIHLDHAGAAGTLVREHPALQVHVSPIGAPHLVDPARLEKSARRLYGDTFDSLWGELAPVPQENVHTVEDRVLGLDRFPTPAHASHHVCYLDPDGTLYAGDACGVRVLPGRFVMPPTPPPEVDVEAWQETLDEIERRAPERLPPLHLRGHDHLRGHRPRAARPHPLRRRRRRRASPHRAAAQPARLGGVGRGRSDGGGVRRVRARAAQRLPRGCADLRLRDAAMAVLPRAQALGREAGGPLVSRLLARKDPRVTGPLSLRDFRYLFSARAISYVGTYLAPIAVAFAILDNGGGATAVGLSFAAWTLAQVAMLAFGGVVGDRVARRTVMIGSDVASTAVRTTMGVLLLSGHAQVWQLIALQACGGAAVAFYSPASYGLVREIVPEEMLQKANGLLAIARYSAFPLGAAVGGSIVVLVGTG